MRAFTVELEALMNKKVIIFLAGILSPAFALAHPGHGDGFVTAFVHPFSGIDHLLMMLFVGVWAGRIGGSARWQLPLSFLAAMTMGFLFAGNGGVMGGITFFGIDRAIAAGLIALGALLAIKLPLQRGMQMLIVLAFALLHGAAHGVELSAAQPWSIIGGFIAATALLHGAGICIAQILNNRHTHFYRAMGATLSMIGCGLLLGG